MASHPVPVIGRIAESVRGVPEVRLELGDRQVERVAHAGSRARDQVRMTKPVAGAFPWRWPYAFP